MTNAERLISKIANDAVSYGYASEQEDMEKDAINMRAAWGKTRGGVQKGWNATKRTATKGGQWAARQGKAVGQTVAKHPWRAGIGAVAGAGAIGTLVAISRNRQKQASYLEKDAINMRAAWGKTRGGVQKGWNATKRTATKGGQWAARQGKAVGQTAAKHPWRAGIGTVAVAGGALATLAAIRQNKK